MSKLNALGQSMAALFTPEGEKLRKAQKDQAQKGPGAAGKAFRLPGAAGIAESGKADDNLGNPNGPLGYDPLRKGAPAEAEEAAAFAAAPTYEIPGAPKDSRTIRLGLGWDKLLVTQKKICEKAKNIFTILEGPVKYRVQKKSSQIQLKSRGSILNLDPELVSQIQEKKKDAA